MSGPVLEKQIEGPVVAWARKSMLVSKMNGMGSRGWPDRCFWIPGGKPFLIEFKRPGGECTPLQLLTHQQLRNSGYDVEVHDDKHRAIAAIKSRVEAAQVPAERDKVLTIPCCGWAVPRPWLGQDVHCPRCGKDLEITEVTIPSFSDSSVESMLRGLAKGSGKVE